MPVKLRFVCCQSLAFLIGWDFRELYMSIDTRNTSSPIDFGTLTENLERVFTPRLVLRPLALADAWPLFAATRNPKFNRELLWAQPATVQAVLERIEIIMDSARRGRLAALCAVVKDTGEWVSLFRFQPQYADASLVEMGIWTHDKFWGDHYSFELTSSCIDAAFTFSDTPSLAAATSALNRGALGVLNQCGLRPTHLARRYTEQGLENEYQEFSITRSQWMQRSRPSVFEQVPFRTAPQPLSLLKLGQNSSASSPSGHFSQSSSPSSPIAPHDADCATAD
jgi:RimJ/RimL family protein N-acetyltransferase